MTNPDFRTLLCVAGFYRWSTALVDMVDFRPGQRIGLACGTGAVTRLIVDRIKAPATALSSGIDMSAPPQEAMAQLGSAATWAPSSFTAEPNTSPRSSRTRRRRGLLQRIHMVPISRRSWPKLRQLCAGGTFASITTFFQAASARSSSSTALDSKSLASLKSNYGISRKSDKVAARVAAHTEEYESCSEERLLRGANPPLPRPWTVALPRHPSTRPSSRAQCGIPLGYGSKPSKWAPAKPSRSSSSTGPRELADRDRYTQIADGGGDRENTACNNRPALEISTSFSIRPLRIPFRATCSGFEKAWGAVATT